MKKMITSLPKRLIIVAPLALMELIALGLLLFYPLAGSYQVTLKKALFVLGMEAFISQMSIFFRFYIISLFISPRPNFSQNEVRVMTYLFTPAFAFMIAYVLVLAGSKVPILIPVYILLSLSFGWGISHVIAGIYNNSVKSLGPALLKYRVFQMLGRFSSRLSDQLYFRSSGDNSLYLSVFSFLEVLFIASVVIFIGAMVVFYANNDQISAGRFFLSVDQIRSGLNRYVVSYLLLWFGLELLFLLLDIVFRIFKKVKMLSSWQFYLKNLMLQSPTWVVGGYLIVVQLFRVIEPQVGISALIILVLYFLTFILIALIPFYAIYYEAVVSVIVYPFRFLREKKNW